jgi:hypothetical protein
MKVTQRVKHIVAYINRFNIENTIQASTLKAKGLLSQNLNMKKCLVGFLKHAEKPENYYSNTWGNTIFPYYFTKEK